MKDKAPVDLQTQILQEQIRTFQTQFEELDRLNVRTIPENMFVHHFLPFFSGEVSENAQEIMTNWLTIAGSAVNPVNVVSNSGQIVVQVPPVQNNTGLDPTATSQTNLAYTAKEANAMAGLSPMAAQSILSSELGVKLTAMTKDITQSNMAHEAKWNDLLTHYGKKPLNYKSEEKVKDSGDDVFDF